MSRRMPTEKAIREYWADHIDYERKGFDSREEFLEEGTCFACGFDWCGLEKAHIYPRIKGGADGPENLHLLCRECHRASEGLEGGEEYWDWFYRRDLWDIFALLFLKKGGSAADLSITLPRDLE